MAGPCSKDAQEQEQGEDIGGGEAPEPVTPKKGDAFALSTEILVLMGLDSQESLGRDLLHRCPEIDGRDVRRIFPFYSSGSFGSPGWNADSIIFWYARSISASSRSCSSS
jgi:hypothetical protein